MSKSTFQNDAIFWVEVDKISPNPYQPRKDFTEQGLKDLAESIRMYGVLQPLTVTRREVQQEGGLSVEYELIAGERRLRASKLAGLIQVPVIIRSGPQDDRVKLELAIIENLQREDLNPIDRAKAFKQLSDEFSFTHSQIAKKVGKSREYVSNSIRLLNLPVEIQSAISSGKISEGHARPLGMLRDKPEEQTNVFREIVLKKLTVREAERIARGIAKDKVRKLDSILGPDLQRMQKQLSETLGTRVLIEPKEVGGKLVIDYFSEQDVKHLVELVNASLLNVRPGINASMDRYETVLQEKDKERVSLEGFGLAAGNNKVIDTPRNLPGVDLSNDFGVDAMEIKDYNDVTDLRDLVKANLDDDIEEDPFAYLSTLNANDPFDVINELVKESDDVSDDSLILENTATKVDSKQDKDDQFGLNSFSV